MDQEKVKELEKISSIAIAIASLFKPDVTDRIEFIKEYIEPIF